MQIEVNEYNTVINGLRQQIELSRRHFNELKERKDGIMTALAREAADHEATKAALADAQNSAKVLGEAVNYYNRDLDQVLLALDLDSVCLPNPQSVVGQAACSEIEALRTTIADLQKQLRARKRK
jgi:uncharacterized protein YggE